MISYLDNLADVFDEGLVLTMNRVDPAGILDDTSYYHVQFCDGTIRNFCDMKELFDFASMLYLFWHRNDKEEE